MCSFAGKSKLKYNFDNLRVKRGCYIIHTYLLYTIYIDVYICIPKTPKKVISRRTKYYRQYIIQL